MGSDEVVVGDIVGRWVVECTGMGGHLSAHDVRNLLWCCWLVVSTDCWVVHPTNHMQMWQPWESTHEFAECVSGIALQRRAGGRVRGLLLTLFLKLDDREEVHKGGAVEPFACTQVLSEPSHLLRKDPCL